LMQSDARKPLIVIEIKKSWHLLSHWVTLLKINLMLDPIKNFSKQDRSIMTEVITGILSCIFLLLIIILIS
jgi:hypothetical protein